MTVQPPARRVRAALCFAFGDPWQVGEVDLREPAVREVGVRVAACAICHSDIAYSRGAWGGGLPAVYGHEVAGVVDELGAGVPGLRVGDHVVVTLIRSCGRCPACLRGLPALCTQRAALAVEQRSPLRLDGKPVFQALRTAGFAERVVVDASQVVAIAPHVDLVSASLLGCGVLTGVGAVITTAGVEAGSSVAVVGLGGVGLNAVQGAVLAGAGLIAGIDPVAARRAAAAELGADPVIDAAAVASAVEATGGAGFDYVVVTAPSVAAVESGMSMLADAGTLVLVGMPSGATVGIDPEMVAERGLRILGSKVGSARPHLDVPRLAGLYQAGRLELDRLVTHRLPLDQVNEGVEAALSGEALKVVIEP